MSNRKLPSSIEYRIGTAGWSIPQFERTRFPDEGSLLERYSRIFSCVEINSSFYREHQAKTYERWRDSTPENFKFSVKLWQKFTHDERLQVNEQEMVESLGAIQELKEKLGFVLIQLPPSLEFESEAAWGFCGILRNHYEGEIAFEPRHHSWGENEALVLLQCHRITKVEADPEKVLAPLIPDTIRYLRLHGTPVIYRSDYDENRIRKFAEDLRESGGWCIFDNTTFGHATTNALELQNVLKK